MAIVDVLKKLHKTMTGKDSVGETIEEVIGDLDENYTGGGGGGSDLPAPGAAGNVLTSSGTDWYSAPNKLFVTVTKTGDTYGEPSAAAGEIYAAVNNGKTVILTMGNQKLPLVEANYIDGAYYATFGFHVSEDSFFAVTIYDDNGTPAAMDGDIEFGTVLPEPDDHGADRGKVLGVDSHDEYALVDAKNPLILTGAEGENNAVTVSGATLAKIYEAANAGRFVAVDIPLTALGGMTVRLPLIIYNYDSGDDEYSFGFSMAIPVATKGSMITITLENDTTGTIDLNTWTFVQ